jgi:hypothetical protein
LARAKLEQGHDIGGRLERVGDRAAACERQCCDRDSVVFGDEVRARLNARA